MTAISMAFNSVYIIASECFSPPNTFFPDFFSKTIHFSFSSFDSDFAHYMLVASRSYTCVL